MDLVGVTQGLQQQSAAAGLQRDDIFLAAHGELADPNLLRGLQSVAQHDIGFLGEVIRRDHVIRLVEIGRVDFILVDELHEVERLAALKLDAVDLLRIEEDLGPCGVYRGTTGLLRS